MASFLNNLKDAAENAGGDLSKGVTGKLTEEMENATGKLPKGLEGKLGTKLGALATAGNVMSTVANVGKDSEGDKALELLLNTLSTDDFKNKLKDSVADTVKRITEPVMEEQFKKLGDIVIEVDAIKNEVDKQKIEEKIDTVANDLVTATTQEKTGGKKSRRRIKSRITRRQARKGYRTTRKSSSRAVQRTRGRK